MIFEYYNKFVYESNFHKNTLVESLSLKKTKILLYIIILFYVVEGDIRKIFLLCYQKYI